jgi:peptidoglycan/xylan/chitin deacetylase (PgdA/CDA1 family)
VRVRHPLVLCYHAVSGSWPDPLAVQPQSFEQQVRSLLTRRFRPVRADQAISCRGRLFHVTFDDAFRSVQRVVPFLERLQVPLTVFACTRLADAGAPLDVPEVARRAAGYRSELVTMDWDTLAELADRGVEIGSHTVSHPHLSRLADRDLHRELRESRERVESELRRPCRYLAYPYGEEDSRVQAAARRAGYEAAFALAAGERTPYAIPRVGIYWKDDLIRFTMKTSMLRPATVRLLRVYRGGRRQFSGSQR